MVVLLLPPLFVAVMVYVVAGDVAVGVPDITPVVELKVKPDGSPGLMVKLAAAPPVFVGVKAVIATPTL